MFYINYLWISRTLARGRARRDLSVSIYMSTHLLKDHKSEIADDTVYQVSCSCVNCVSYLPFYHAPWGLLHIHSSSLKSPLNSRAATVCEDVSLPALLPCTVRVDIETRLHGLVASWPMMCGVSIPGGAKHSIILCQIWLPLSVGTPSSEVRWHPNPP